MFFFALDVHWHKMYTTQGTQAPPSSERVGSRMRWLLRQLFCGSAIRGLVMTGNPVQDPMKLLWVNLMRHDEDEDQDDDHDHDS